MPKGSSAVRPTNGLYLYLYITSLLLHILFLYITSLRFFRPSHLRCSSVTWLSHCISQHVWYGHNFPLYCVLKLISVTWFLNENFRRELPPKKVITHWEIRRTCRPCNVPSCWSKERTVAAVHCAIATKMASLKRVTDEPASRLTGSGANLMRFKTCQVVVTTLDKFSLIQQKNSITNLLQRR
jgi:valyl-tRNA synthetase